MRAFRRKRVLVVSKNRQFVTVIGGLARAPNYIVATQTEIWRAWLQIAEEDSPFDLVVVESTHSKNDQVNFDGVNFAHALLRMSERRFGLIDKKCW